MTTAAEMSRRLEALKIPGECDQALNENAFYAEDLITDQLRQGKDGNDKFLPDYSRTSVEHFHKAPGPIKLYDQGDFYRGITVKVENGVIKEFSTDKKDEMLTNTYGAAIEKLSPSSIKELIPQVQPTLVDNIRDKTGMK